MNGNLIARALRSMANNGVFGRGKREPRQYNRRLFAKILSSGLFDVDWYARRAGMRTASAEKLLKHYLEEGFRLGLNPSPFFDTAYYLNNYPDVLAAGANPLWHFLTMGKKEGRERAIAIDLEDVEAFARNRESAKPLVIFESHNLRLQGAQTSLLGIASGLVGGKYDVLLATGSDGPLRQSYQDMGIPSFIHNVPSLSIQDGHEFHIERLASFYKASGADLIHVNTLTNSLSAIAARRANLPYVWNIREGGAPEQYFSALPAHLCEEGRDALSEASAAIFVAECTRKQCARTLTLPEQTFVIRNGLDVESFCGDIAEVDRTFIRKRLGIGAQDVLVLNVGTVCERKGQRDLIDVANLLRAPEMGQVVIAISGMNDGDYSTDLRHAAENVLKTRILLSEETSTLDQRNAILHLYRAADIFVLTSRAESYPRVTLEAMAFGLPIVATPCAGVTEQLEDGISAQFYEEEDITGLSQILDRLIAQPVLRRRLGEAARDRLSRIQSWEQMVSSYTSVYDRILGR